MGWERDLYGNVYKSEKTKNAATKRKATNEAKKQREYEAYDRAFTGGVQSYAKQNNLQYSDDLKNAARAYYENQKVRDDFMKKSVNESKSRNRAELKSHASFASDEDGQSKIKEYNEAKKKMGMQPDNMVTKKKYDQMFGYDTKRGYDTGTINRYEQYLTSKDLKVNHNSKEKSEKASSFDDKADKGINGLVSFINKVKNSKVVEGAENLAKDITDNKLGHAYTEFAKQVVKHTPAGQQVENMKAMNKAMPYVDQYGGAASTRNVLSSIKDGKDQSTKDIVNDIKSGFTGKKKTSGEDLAKQWGNDSKYGSKLEGLGIEAVADPTNLIGVGIGSKVLKSASKLSKMGKITEEGIKAAELTKITEKLNKTGKVSKSDSKKLLQDIQSKQLKEIEAKKVADEEANRLNPGSYPKNFEGLHIIKDEYPMDVKASLQKANEQIKTGGVNKPDVPEQMKQLTEQINQLSPKEQNLQNIKLPNGKIEVQPTIKKSLMDLMGRNKQVDPLNTPITPREVFEQQVEQSTPQVENIQPPLNNSVEQPVSIADNFQSAINKARETNNPQDIESIKQHTQDLIDDLDNNYKDDDAEEVKDALAKLNLQLFAGKEPVQDTLAKIEGVVERAKTLKKDIKETNPQLAKEIQGIKDINSVGKASRNLYEVVDKLPKQQKNEILTVLNKAKVDNVNYQKMYVNDLDRYIVNPKTGLGIKKGSKESALIQDYGEKTLAKKELEKQGYTQEQIDKMDPEELSQLNDKILKEQHSDKYDKIKKADNFFRERYKELIDAANTTIAKIYPGQPDKLIPERSDYYHHFNEMEGLGGVINQFRTPENINPDLVTVSHGTKPKTKWQAFKQKRGLGEYKSDAVGGFLKYIQGVSHTTHVDPVIPAIRNVVKDLQNATEESKNINNIIEALNDHADDIAGKTNPYDRTIQKVLGRANLRRLNALNGRVKSNMILGNVGSTVAQVGNLPLITAKAKHHLAPGLYDTLEQFSRFATKSKKDLPIHKSNFLRERFIDEDFSKFDTKILDQPKKLAVKMMTMVDKASASLAWNSFYRQGLSKKVPNPIKYADELTRNTLAGRGVGEMGLGQKSKTAQIFMPFTYEVGHQWKVLNGMVGKKDAAGIMTFLVTSYALNKVIEQVRGSGVSFDPIDALIDGYENGEGDKKHKVLAALGSLSGEVVGNIPGGNSVTSALGDKNLFGSDVSLDDIFQDRDPNRFGSGLTVSKALESPSFAVLPFGANQVKKAVEGYKSIKDDGVYTKNGQIMYPVDTSSNLKKAQMYTFGKYSPSEAREYFEEKRLPLSPKRTSKVNEADDKFKEYNKQLIELIENKKKRNKGNPEKIKELNKQLEKLKEKNKK